MSNDKQMKTAHQILTNNCEPIPDGDDKYINITEGLAIDILEEYAQQFKDELSTAQSEIKRLTEENNYLIDGIRKGQHLSESIKWDDGDGTYTANESEIIRLTTLNADLIKAAEIAENRNKDIHRKEIESAYESGYSNGAWSAYSIPAKVYYNNTFETKQQ